MAGYMIAREGVTPTAGNMLLGLTTGLQEIALIKEVRVQGEASSAGINRMTLRRSTTNLTTPTAQTPAKKSSTSPAAYTDGSTTATGEPTTAASPAVLTDALQCFGGRFQFKALDPLDAILIQGATAGNNEVTLESTSGTNVVSCDIDFDEV